MLNQLDQPLYRHLRVVRVRPVEDAAFTARDVVRHRLTRPSFVQCQLSVTKVNHDLPPSFCRSRRRTSRQDYVGLAKPSEERPSQERPDDET